ncbi:unnamed protein product, partial [Ectocarpus sp. 12 AP-2014]
VYTKNLQGVPEEATWRHAGRVLELTGNRVEADLPARWYRWHSWFSLGPRTSRRCFSAHQLNVDVECFVLNIYKR